MTLPDVKRFVLTRLQDVSGVSGVGHVADGCVFHDGQCVLKWRTHVNSLAVYPTVTAALLIHGHDGKTQLEWVD